MKGLSNKLAYTVASVALLALLIGAIALGIDSQDAAPQASPPPILAQSAEVDPVKYGRLHHS